MIDKRYQVFVSSTYTDLIEERQNVMQALMETDCIPAGMELFPAADDDQWSFIKRIIDNCDYYLLIIIGKYGSLTKEDISYTEKEFDYAKTKNIPIICFIHKNPEDIPIKKSETNQKIKTKLLSFIEKEKSNRLKVNNNV